MGNEKFVHYMSISRARLLLLFGLSSRVLWTIWIGKLSSSTWVESWNKRVLLGGVFGSEMIYEESF